jgi:hypothetical protein
MLSERKSNQRGGDSLLLEEIMMKANDLRPVYILDVPGRLCIHHHVEVPASLYIISSGPSLGTHGVHVGPVSLR